VDKAEVSAMKRIQRRSPETIRSPNQKEKGLKKNASCLKDTMEKREKTLLGSDRSFGPKVNPETSEESDAKWVKTALPSRGIIVKEGGDNPNRKRPLQKVRKEAWGKASEQSLPLSLSDRKKQKKN